jgi:hypothetical protein
LTTIAAIFLFCPTPSPFFAVLAFTGVKVGDPVEAVKAIATLIKGKCDRNLCALNKI